MSQANINFKREYSFDDLRTSKGGKCRFDFALFDEYNNLSCLVEYQGEQHFYKSNFYGTQQKEETDELKRQYCFIHNIKLLEITYKDDIDAKIEEIIKSYKRGEWD